TQTSGARHQVAPAQFLNDFLHDDHLASPILAGMMRRHTSPGLADFHAAFAKARRPASCDARARSKKRSGGGGERFQSREEPDQNDRDQLRDRRPTAIARAM